MKKIAKMTLTIVGILVLLIIIISLIGISSFDKKVKKEKTILFTSNAILKEKISENDLKELPELMKNYLIKTKIIGKPKYCHVTFRQKGKIQTDPKKGWISFSAIQHMSSNNPGFIWKAKALPMLIRDKYLNQKGEVLVSLLGIKNVEQHTGAEVDQSSLGRYFGELIWFPIGFLDPDITWENVDHKTVKGTITKDNQSLIGYFYFDENGMIESYRTKRYRGTTLEDFIGEVGEYKLYNQMLLPNKMIAIWDLEDRRLVYFNASIIDYKIE
ncbi:DUF6544 family protein [Aquimarina gracilis]|uniref:DUF6544 family protein n=1 Tax=Aquimarina gracilis TaxID=874422 RepID=A0ABU6A0P8_9FLAO|nr:DUF6544 family protein [Aquimarina gracilis]MEB3347676.1 DUF6544 family protein [Aquimarina gracilis]